MSQKTAKTIARVIAVILAVALVITTFTFVFSWADSPDNISWEKEFEVLKDLIIKTKSDYKDEVSYETLFSGAFKGVMESLNDPYSVYFPSEEDRQEFEESVSGEFFGVGVSLEQVSGRIVVVSPIAGGPAERAGILSGDIITAVDGNDTGGLSLEEVASKLRGKDGTQVVMTVNRNGKSINYTLTREKIKPGTVDFRLIEDDIGYIAISQFGKNTNLEFKNAKLQLIAKGAKSFIVDVRNNPGGYVDVAVDIAEQFMPKGPIVHFQKKNKIVETINAKGTGDLKRPVVLLINEGSASASEILAAAWQDSKTAKLVGTTTYGKGVAQQLYTIGNRIRMKLSVFYFLGPNKNVIDKAGIKPDYYVQNAAANHGEAKEELLVLYQQFAPMNENLKPKPGDTGLNVFGAQQRLSLLGYRLSLSGRMDENMFNHVKSFQKEAGLYPYGILDFSTMAALDKAAKEYVLGAGNAEDLQLKKAVELLL